MPGAEGAGLELLVATTGRRSPHVSSRTTGTGLFEKCAQHIRTTLRDAFPE
ncbi:hypothetical protein AB0B79_14115 [Streptomyces sp. NPDC039022]